MILFALVALALLAGYWLSCNFDIWSALPDWHRASTPPWLAAIGTGMAAAVAFALCLAFAAALLIGILGPLLAFAVGYWFGANRDLAAWLPDWHRSA